MCISFVCPREFGWKTDAALKRYLLVTAVLRCALYMYTRAYVLYIFVDGRVCVVTLARVHLAHVYVCVYLNAWRWTNTVVGKQIESEEDTFLTNDDRESLPLLYATTFNTTYNIIRVYIYLSCVFVCMCTTRYLLFNKIPSSTRNRHFWTCTDFTHRVFIRTINARYTTTLRY